MRKYLSFGAVLFLALCFRAFGDYNATQGTGTIFRAFSAANGGTSLCAAANTQCQAVALINPAGADIGAAMLSALQGSIPAGTAIIGKVGVDQTTPGTTNAVAISTIGTTPIVADPCQAIAKTYTSINIGSATTTRIIAPTAAKKTFICSIDLFAFAADNIAIVEGTGGTCGAGTAGIVGGTTTATGISFPAQGGLAKGTGASAVWATAGTNVDFCLITSTTGPLTGTVAWVQQ